MSDQKILIDTSIWIEYFRNNENYVPFIDDNLNLEKIIITGLIISELLHGVKSSKELECLPALLSPSPILNVFMKTG